MNVGGLSTDKHSDSCSLSAVWKMAVRDRASLMESWGWQGTVNNANIFLLEGNSGGHSVWESKESPGYYSKGRRGA